MIRTLRTKIYLWLWRDERGRHLTARRTIKGTMIEPKWYPRIRDSERTRLWTRVTIGDNTVTAKCLTTGEVTEHKVTLKGDELYDLVTLISQRGVTTDTINGYLCAKEALSSENDNIVHKKDEHKQAKIININEVRRRKERQYGQQQ